MRTTLCILALTLVALTSASSQTTQTFPRVVAKGKFVGQTAPISLGTAFKAIRNGVYRVSMYLTVTTYNSSSSNCWTPEIQWTDDSGLQLSEGHLSACANSAAVGSSAVGPGLVNVIEAKGGTHINLGVLGSSDGSVYSFYYVIEALALEAAPAN